MLRGGKSSQIVVKAQPQRVLLASRHALGDDGSPAQPKPGADPGQQSQGRTGKQTAPGWRRAAACGRLVFARRKP